MRLAFQPRRTKALCTLAFMERGHKFSQHDACTLCASELCVMCHVVWYNLCRVWYCGRTPSIGKNVLNVPAGSSWGCARHTAAHFRRQWGGQQLGARTSCLRASVPWAGNEGLLCCWLWLVYQLDAGGDVSCGKSPWLKIFCPRTCKARVQVWPLHLTA